MQALFLKIDSRSTSKVRVSAQEKFQLVYSLLRHEFLGYVFEAHVVQCAPSGKLTLKHQAISPDNLEEFAAGADMADGRLVTLCAELQQERIVRRFAGKKVGLPEFFNKHFAKETKSPVRELVLDHIEQVKGRIVSLLPGKPIYVMGQDGNPAWQGLEMQAEQATIRFHFFRNEGDTQYFPTLRWRGEKLDIYHQDGAILCNRPATLMLQGKVYTVAGQADGRKLMPFLTKKFVSVPRQLEAQYYSNFVAPLIATEDVVAKGFDLELVREPARFSLRLEAQAETITRLFDDGDAPGKDLPPTPLGPGSPAVLRLQAHYGSYCLVVKAPEEVTVISEPAEGTYRFVKIMRDAPVEKEMLAALAAHGLPMREGRASLSLSEALAWLQGQEAWLAGQGISLAQALPEEAHFELGRPGLRLQAMTRTDWFELDGEVEIAGERLPFRLVRLALSRHERWVRLPSGRLLPIPQDWIEALAELALSSKDKGEGPLVLKAHQIGIVSELLQGAGVSAELPPGLAQRLEAIREPKPFDLPKEFKGKLRPYQMHGYNWLQTMREAGLGACLADDMGLGKTVQTLALLASVHQAAAEKRTSLLVVPNSLLYNWEREARRFAPHLRVLRHIGQQRHRSSAHFNYYHLVITSYGTMRSDREIFEKFTFAVAVLDEAHAIKNHDSATARAVYALKADWALSLTGTPIENNLMELWSQMHYLNPGLLGTVATFRQYFALPIERNLDQDRLVRLRKAIRPFLLRRLKSEVAQDLPAKTIQTVYCEMGTAQREAYERVKNTYRTTIFEKLEEGSLAQNRFLVLRGLMHLRQIACHPALTEPDFSESSGKFESLTYKLAEALEEGHKVLIFSQFVRHLQLVRKYLEANKISYAYLDGQTQARAAEVDRFEKQASVKVFLLSLKAGGVGLNLTSADYVFVLDPWWNPAAESQAIDRAHRIGQRKAVFVYKFITRETVEERILELQERKAALAHHLISGEDTMLGQLTDDQVREIFT